jgi:hypothetical protein
LNNVDVRHDEQYQFYTAYGNYYSESARGRKPIHKADAKQNADVQSSIGEDEY